MSGSHAGSQTYGGGGPQRGSSQQHGSSGPFSESASGSHPTYGGGGGSGGPPRAGGAGPEPSDRDLYDEDEDFEGDDDAEYMEEEEEEESEGTLSDEGEEDQSWINWFVGLRGNSFFCEVDEEFIQDDFNLTGLQTAVPLFDFALDFILDVEIPTDTLTEEQQEIVETAAEVLYGLIHARYILTQRGMQRMYEKYQEAEFGRCPRVHCQGQSCLPAGLSDQQRTYPVNIFCPRCQNLYYPRSTKQAGLDGAYFGTTFAHMFLLSFPELIPRKKRREITYIPRIYGFKINKESVYHTLRQELEEEDDEEDEEDEDDDEESGSGEHEGKDVDVDHGDDDLHVGDRLTMPSLHALHIGGDGSSGRVSSGSTLRGVLSNPGVLDGKKPSSKQQNFFGPDA